MSATVSSSTGRPVILVTGGAGYIGSHACKSLSEQDFLPVVVDNLVHGHRQFVRWGPFEEANILDRAALDEILARYRPVAVLHFAAFAYVGESVTTPLKYYNNNVGGTLALLSAMKDHGVRSIVFSSTCATYGVPDKVPIVETSRQQPINPYGTSKLMAERILEDCQIAHGTRCVMLRYFNAAGADHAAGLGELHDPETHLIPLALHAADGSGPPLTIFGDDYDTPDGTCIRDYIHVADLADAHVIALRRLLQGGDSAAFNLGTGSGASILEVIDSVERITGNSVPRRIGPRRSGDPPVLVSDVRAAARELGWKATRSQLDNIVATAWAWQSNRGN